MIVAIPVNENNEQTKVSTSFGRAPFFLLFDTESGTKTYIENFAASSQGGAGIKAAQIVIDQNADALIAKRCGENAAKVLYAAEIKIYKADTIPVVDVLHEYNLGKLEILEDIHPGFHGKQE